LAKWALLLQEFEIVYVSQKAIKGQALVDFLVDHPIPDEWKFSEDLPDEDVLFIEMSEPWKMFFDGAARQDGAGAGLYSSHGKERSCLSPFHLPNVVLITWPNIKP
jgi:hypothetical protein